MCLIWIFKKQPPFSGFGRLRVLSYYRNCFLFHMHKGAMGCFGRQEGQMRSRPWYSKVHLEMGLPGLTECTSVSNIQTNQILMTKQSKKVPTFSNMNLFFSDIYLLGCPGSLLWNEDSISLIRDQTWALCIGSLESSPLDHQQSPPHMIFYISNRIKTVFMGESRFF